MNKNSGGGGVGVGSASIILIFAVLCLTVFSLITFVVSNNDKVLVQSESRFVLGYYEADSLAERVLDELLKTDLGIMPAPILGIEIDSEYDLFLGANVYYYSCPVSDEKELSVKLARTYDSYDILSWKMRDTGEWQMDTSLNVFMGFDDMDAPMWDMTAPMWDTEMDFDADPGSAILFPWEIDDDDDTGESDDTP